MNERKGHGQLYHIQWINGFKKLREFSHQYPDVMGIWTYERARHIDTYTRTVQKIALIYNVTISVFLHN